MKKLLFVLAFSVAAVTVNSSLYAACYQFSNGDGYKVCVKGNSFSDRAKAKEICKKAKGSDCGNIQSYSSSCNGKCVDENGQVKSSLSGY